MTNIRPATQTDLAAVQRISRDAYTQHIPALGVLIQPGVEDYAPRITAGRVWVLEDGGAIAGLIVIERHPDHALIFSVAVAPDAQGRGHASTLLRFAEDQACAWRLREVRLYTNLLMTRNTAIYARAGYRETGRQPSPKRAHHTQVNMSKALSDLLPERVEVVGLDHLYLTVTDVATSEPWYDAVFGLLDYRKTDTAIAGDPHRHYFNRIMQVSIRQAKTAAPHDPYAPGLHHVCLQVADNAAVDTFHRLITAHGIAATAPATYPQYANDYYATFLADPDGLKFEIVARRARRKLYAERWSELTTWLNPIQKIKI